MKGGADSASSEGVNKLLFSRRKIIQFIIIIIFFS
jgi:hypothetical protein